MVINENSAIIPEEISRQIYFFEEFLEKLHKKSIFLEFPKKYRKES